MADNSIENDLQALGSAKVIVVLKGGAAAAAVDPSEIRKHFTKPANSQAAELASSLRSRGGAAAKAVKAPVMRHYPNLGIALGTVDRKGLRGLNNDKKRVAEVVAAPRFSLIWPMRVAAAELSVAVTPGIKMLRVPELWDKGFTGKGVLVGHLDTGADGKHATLKTAIQHFAEFDELGEEITPTPDAFDSDDHGTHTAATIAGRPVNNRHVGVAPEALLATAIVIEGGDVIARILGGMDWALGKGVRILSMSLGLRGFNGSFLPITQILRERGVLPVMAVGNEGPGTSRSPGNYSEALSVGACDDSKDVADFSSSQRFVRTKDPIVPDLLCPGVAVISARPGGGFQEMDGTSMATPHLAGLAALLMQAKPASTVSKIETAIFKSCKKPAAVPKARGNRGIPDGVKALSFL